MDKVKLLIQKMTDNNYSVEQIAEKFKVSTSTIYKVKSGDIKISNILIKSLEAAKACEKEAKREAAKAREKEAAKARKKEAAKAREKEAAKARKKEAAIAREKEAAKAREKEAAKAREKEAAKAREKEAAKAREKEAAIPKKEAAKAREKEAAKAREKEAAKTSEKEAKRTREAANARKRKAAIAREKEAANARKRETSIAHEKETAIVPKKEDESKVIIAIPARGPKGADFDHRTLQWATNECTAAIVNTKVQTVENFKKIFQEFQRPIPSIIPKEPSVFGDLHQVDFIFIPGRSKEQEFDENRAELETSIINQALLTGMPVLSVCAGTWRLWSCYNRYILRSNFGDLMAKIIIGFVKGEITGPNITKDSFYDLDVYSSDIELFFNMLIINNNEIKFKQYIDCLKQIVRRHQWDDIKFLQDVAGHNNRRMMNITKNGVNVGYNIIKHNIDLKKNSLIHQTMEVWNKSSYNHEAINVNSVHWRAVKQEKIKCPIKNKFVNICPFGLEISATSHDKSIEAFSSTVGAPLIGVQWHPEAFARKNGSPNQRLIRRMVLQSGLAYHCKKQINPALLKISDLLKFNKVN